MPSSSPSPSPSPKPEEPDNARTILDQRYELLAQRVGISKEVLYRETDGDLSNWTSSIDIGSNPVGKRLAAYVGCAIEELRTTDPSYEHRPIVPEPPRADETYPIAGSRGRRTRTPAPQPERPTDPHDIPQSQPYPTVSYQVPLRPLHNSYELLPRVEHYTKPLSPDKLVQF
ncbi:hypothetical protein DDE82_009140 [Stemphylium lycopersici]|uniref:Uncharacterized protein n=1 Tax=Stemphylium lycopersici TaxID=183478 RepID=A0A364MRK3_STELY|nr:hypothetical protein DDE82_009140 [Stemphylium lycopersici]RAQ99622.1 hypothetical protein DDE83_009185 [Stemphylium lycopersici]